MQDSVSGFPPYWLIISTTSDNESMKVVEQFMNEIPRDIHGAIVLTNTKTLEVYRGADRYMPILAYLAMLWMHNGVSLTLSGFKTGEKESTLIDTSTLHSLRKSPAFLHAMNIGEEAWRIENERRIKEKMYEETEPEDS